MKIEVSVMKSAEYGSLSRDRKEELFRCANLVFFPNNRYLGFPTKNKKQEALLAQQGQADILKQKKGQADQYSRDIIQWYQTRIKPEREMFLEGETLGKFVNQCHLLNENSDIMSEFFFSTSNPNFLIIT